MVFGIPTKLISTGMDADSEWWLAKTTQSLRLFVPKSYKLLQQTASQMLHCSCLLVNNAKNTDHWQV